MKSQRVIFLGTPDFARDHLNFLIHSEDFEVCGVVTQPDRASGRKLKLKKSPVKELAEQHNIPCVSPEKISEVYEEVKAWQAHAVVVVAFGQILPQSFLNMFPDRVVNIHASLLPRWRGAAPIQRAIMAGDNITGVSLQVMVKELDAGDVIGERSIALREDMNAIDLHDCLKVLGQDLLKEEFYNYLKGDCKRTPQNAGQITYAHKIQKSESKIDWSLSALQIYKNYLGLMLGPGVHTSFESKKLKLIEFTPEMSISGNPGEVQAVDVESVTVSCGEGAIVITKIQPESKPKMDVKSYLLGNKIEKGEVLGE